jgi:hypothetical protein
MPRAKTGASVPSEYGVRNSAPGEPKRDNRRRKCTHTPKPGKACPECRAAWLLTEAGIQYRDRDSKRRAKARRAAARLLRKLLARYGEGAA